MSVLLEVGAVKVHSSTAGGAAVLDCITAGGVVGRLAKGAKALVVSELIAIFLVPLSTSLSSIRSFWQFFFLLVAL